MKKLIKEGILEKIKDKNLYIFFSYYNYILLEFLY